MRDVSRALLLVALIATGLIWPLSYGVLRVSHLFVHDAFFTSAEGLDGHVDHSMEGHLELQRIYSPLIAAELWFWRQWRP